LLTATIGTVACSGGADDTGPGPTGPGPILKIQPAVEGFDTLMNIGNAVKLR
jgi:hypothetical protein